MNEDNKNNDKNKKPYYGIKLAHYLDCKQLSQRRHIAIQLDSIVAKLTHIKDWSNHIVFLDEINTIISYALTSTTLRVRRIDIIAKLIEIVRNCNICYALMQMLVTL